MQSNMKRVKDFLKRVLSWGRNGVVAVLALLGFAVVVIISVAVGIDCYQRHARHSLDRWSSVTDVSNDVQYIEEGRCGGYIYNKERDEKTLRRLRWIAMPADDDSLAVFATDGKRGYFNVKNGEAVLPAVYERAWVFSEGIAAVEQDGKVRFIGHDGQKVFDREFKTYWKSDDYVFHGGYCPVRDYDSHLLGLIDREGRNVLPFEYRKLQHAAHDLWIAGKNGKVGLLDSTLNVIIPDEYKKIAVVDKEGIYVMDHENICRLLDFDGKTMLRNMVIANVIRLEYVDENLDDGSTDLRQAACFAYTCDVHTPIYYGLMDASGKLLTKPVFKSVEAITRDLYLCQPGGVLLNSNGEEL